MITFTVDNDQLKKLNAWGVQHDDVCPYAGVDANGSPLGGAIGGRITFTFTDTSLGRVCRVQCACGKAIDLTDYNDW